ncbi:HIT family protein [Pelosinus sp. sgz500959]|uniref:HIT family protein n=1 Tax=Pelosinus sp. sgz500959 TaxID=3242472 RepID=UPI00366CDF73
MSDQNNCFYCTKDEKLTDIMIKICELEASILYLFKEQTYRGRCVIAYKEHKSEIFHLTDEERNLFMKDVARVAAAIDKGFSPNKINYGAYADKMTHLHYHIVPKYENGPSWGGTFEMMPQEKVLLSAEEYQQLINQIKENL